MLPKDLQKSLTRNRLLAVWLTSNGKQAAHKVEPVLLSDKQVLHEPGDVLKHVYFPTSAVVSMVSAMEEGFSIEVATMGHEGMVGIGVFLGFEKAFAKAIVQAPGEAFKMRTDVFRSEADRVQAFAMVLRRYTHVLLVQISRSGGCNSLHSLEARYARWLLAMHDRSKTDELPLTQEFLGDMLGVRRPSVSVVAAKLQKSGLIGYNRGRIKIIDRARLEKTACECYQILKEEYDRLLT